MNRRRVPVVVFSVSMLVASLAWTAATASPEWPTRWQVNGNGVTGELEFSIRDDGSLIGRLMDEYVEGYVSGRHLFVRRAAGDRAEVWEGWLGKPRPGDNAELIVAGTISVDEAGQTMVYPWFGTPDAGSSPSSISSAAPSTEPTPVPATPPGSPTESPRTSSATQPTPSEPAPDAEAPQAASSPSGGLLTGTWTSTTGDRAEVFQDGKTLTVTLADGLARSGRMTGASTLVVGLRKGCCNGELESPDVIVWSDGARWQRAD